MLLEFDAVELKAGEYVAIGSVAINVTRICCVWSADIKVCQICLNHPEEVGISVRGDFATVISRIRETWHVAHERL